MKTTIAGLSFLIISISSFLMVPYSRQMSNDSHAEKKLDSCVYNGKKLYGKVQFVEFANQADFKVQIVNNFPDLKVRFVENFADQCGEWQVVENGIQADFKVFITESFADFKIQTVMNFPGLP